MTETHTIRTTLWIWTSDKAPASWHFLTIAGVTGEAIHALALMRRLESGLRRGWGAMKVAATIGGTSWETSMFPDKASGGWFLPIKASVRKAEGLVAGDEVEVTIAV